MEKCSQCEKDATTHYVWEWGEEGFACDNHRAALQDTAKRVARSIVFDSLGGKASSSRSSSGEQDPEHPLLWSQLQRCAHELEIVTHQRNEARAEAERLAARLDLVEQANADLVEQLNVFGPVKT